MKKLAWGISAVLPRLYMPWNSLDRAKLTPNMEQRNKDEADPLLWHYGTRAGYAVEMFKAIDKTVSKFPEFSVKTFILHGKDDDICDYSGSVKFAEAQPELVEIVTYDYPYHSLLHLLPEV